MNVFEALILGLVQGLTEFLPVSSSGHLVLAQSLLGIEVSVFFDIMLHVATLAAVCIVFFKDILNLFKPPFRTLLYLVIATVPAVIVMFLLKDHIDTLFGETFLPFAFLITAALLFVTEIFTKKSGGELLKPIDAKISLLMGAAQAVAVIPGISRSGSTIGAGLIAGGRREDVARFSFLMSIPIILGSAGYSALTDTVAAAAADIPALLAGMAAAFVSGFIAIRFMLKLIQKCNYKWFSLYLALLAVFTFLKVFVIKF
jgi:undecaprenyl-diphosphatase